MKNREEFEGGLEKGKGKGGEKKENRKRVIKHTLNIFMKLKLPQKIHKNSEEF